MKNLILIMTAALSLGRLASADGDKGLNGGNVVYCETGSSIKVEMLDYFESREEWGLHLDLGAASLDPIQKVHIALDRMKRFHPDSAAQLSARADGFFQDANLISGVELTTVDDSNQHFLPAGCGLKQLAVQRPKEFAQDKTFLINKDVWDLLTNDQKAGLILHEIIYEKLLHTTPPTLVGFNNQKLTPESRMARYVNALISSSEFSGYDETAYLAMYQNVWFISDFIFQGHPLSQVTFSATSFPQGKNPTMRAKTMAGFDVNLLGTSFHVSPNSVPSWYISGGFASFHFDGQNTITAFNQPLQIINDLQFYPEGTIQTLNLAHSLLVSLPNGSTVELSKRINLYTTGELATFVADREEQLQTPNGSAIWVEAPTPKMTANTQLWASGAVRALACPSKKHSFTLHGRLSDVLCDSAVGTCKELATGKVMDWPTTVMFKADDPNSDFTAATFQPENCGW